MHSTHTYVTNAKRLENISENGSDVNHQITSTDTSNMCQKFITLIY